MFNIGPPELIVLLLIALLIVGPKRLPEVGKTIGRSLREFRKAQDDLKTSFNFDVDDEPAKKEAPATSKTPPAEQAAAPEATADVTPEAGESDDGPPPSDADDGHPPSDADDGN